MLDWPLPLGYIVFAILMITIQIADIITSTAMMNRAGTHEMNPLMNFILKYLGNHGMILVKGFAIGLLMWIVAKIWYDPLIRQLSISLSLIISFSAIIINMVGLLLGPD